MALNTSKFNHLASLGLKGLIIREHKNTKQKIWNDLRSQWKSCSKLTLELNNRVWTRLKGTGTSYVSISYDTRKV